MKKSIFATMAIATLIAAGCTQDELVVNDSGYKGGNDTPLSFTPVARNATRATIGFVHGNNIGVYAYKYVKETNGTLTPTCVMTNYKVSYYTKDGDNKDLTTPFWKYEDEVVGQDLVFWDKTAEYYEFYGYLNHQSTPPTVDNTTKTISVGTLHHGFENGTEADGDKADVKQPVAYKKSVKAEANTALPANTIANGSEVPLDFLRYNSQVRFAFVDGLKTSTKYSLTIDAIEVKFANICTKGDLTLSPITSGDKVNQGALTFVPDATDGYATDWTTTKFSAGTGVIGKDTPTYTNLYYCLPSQASNKNGKMTVYVTYTYTHLKSDNTTESTTYNRVEVEIPADDVQWESNHLYTYKFTISLTPIVFNNLTISNYPEVVNSSYGIIENEKTTVTP